MHPIRQHGVIARLSLARAWVTLLMLVAALATGAVSAHATPGPVPDPMSSPPTTSTVPPTPAWMVIGYSNHDRPIEAIRFGNGPNRVLVVGGIHATEYGYDVANKLAAFLLANPSALPSGVQLDIVPMANPDGRAMRQRANAHGVDLNRNFPARNWRRIKPRGGSSGTSPGSEAETQVLMRLMETVGYSRVISLHSRGPLVDFDGPGSLKLARRLGRKARMPVVRLSKTRRYPGSMGSWVPQRFGIPIITVELKNRSLPYRLRIGVLAAME